MRSAVRQAWPAFISPYEGRIDHMYLDTAGWVTFGVGRKIDDDGTFSEVGLVQPWRDKVTGDLVTEARIRNEFALFKAHPELAPLGGGHDRQEALATLVIDEASIDEELLNVTEEFWQILAKTLPNLDPWPADAQLAILDMAFNLGPYFLTTGKWPKFTAAAKAGDFPTCAVHCMRAVRAPRDFHNRALFHLAAAAAVTDDNGKRPVDPAVLHG